MTAMELLPPRDFREGPIGLRGWLRPEGAPRAPLAVVICPGNPAEQFGSSHAGAPLIVALAGALASRSVPVVTFDYQGVGMSGPDGNNEDPKTWKAPGDPIPSVTTAVAWAKEKVSDHIVIYGYSFGSAQALSSVISGDCYAYVSIAIGTKFWVFFEDPITQDMLKKSMELHSCLTCKALYIIGAKDRMSPKKDVEGLIAGRKDGGAGADLRIIPQGVHHLEGLEDNVGAMCADWVAGLRKELLAKEERAPAKAAEQTVGGDSMFDFDDLDDTMPAQTDVKVKDNVQVNEQPGKAMGA